MEKKEFYGLIYKKRKEIDNLGIPKNKKEELYLIVEKTIQRYEQRRINYLNSKTLIKKLFSEMENETIH